MFPVPDALAGFYLICFGVGLLFTFLSLFLGMTHDTLHIPGLSQGDGAHLDAGHDLGHGSGGEPGIPEADGHVELSNPEGAAGHGGAPHGGHGVSPFNLSTIMAFITWFGGAGYILEVYAGFWGLLSIVGASLAGLVGGAVIFYFLARILLPGERVLDPADYRLVGTVARVTAPIAPDRVGEIVYAKGGSRRSDGARSSEGSAIGRGTEVVIVRYEKGIAYVEPWNSFVQKG